MHLAAILQVMYLNSKSQVHKRENVNDEKNRERKDADAYAIDDFSSLRPCPSKSHLISSIYLSIVDARSYLDISSVILDVRAETMQQVAQFVTAKAGRSLNYDQQLAVRYCH